MRRTDADADLDDEDVGVAGLDDDVDDGDDDAHVLVPARLPVFRDGNLVYVESVLAIPEGWTCEGGLLRPPPQPEPSPEPEELWVQRVPTIGPADRPAVRQPYLEVWHGTPEAPDARVRCLLVRDEPTFRDVGRWRRALGPVGIEVRRYPLFAVDGATGRGEVLVRIDASQAPPAGDVGGALAPIIVAQLPGTGIAVRLTDTGQRDAAGLPIYVATAAQVERLVARLRA